jgi:hypothetical protein
MEESDPAKKALCTKPGRSGERRRGKLKLRRCEELEEDVAWFGCKTWRTNAKSRKDSGKPNGKVKSHPGM